MPIKLKKWNSLPIFFAWSRFQWDSLPIFFAWRIFQWHSPGFTGSEGGVGVIHPIFSLVGGRIPQAIRLQQVNFVGFRCQV